MRALISTLLVIATTATAMAQAQPYPQQPYPQPQPQPYPQPQPQPYPAPQPYPQPGYAQPPMQVQLTIDEQYLLQRGYISDGQHIAGGAVALFFGLGVGHAIQGRWSEKGYIFTIGDIGTSALFIWGFANLMTCIEGCSEQRTDRAGTMMLIGGLGLLVFRTWETIDAFTGPAEHNSNLRALHLRLGMRPPMYTRLSPYLGRPHDGGTVAGLSLRF